MPLSLMIEDGLFETRAAVLRDNELVDLQIERPNDISRVGDFYLGTVTKVLNDQESAFVSIARDEAGFLQARHISRNTRNIKSQVHEGQKLLVQVIKDPLDEKGPQLSCQYELASASLVYQPTGKGLTLSKQIRDKEALARLEAMATRHLKEGGLIIRTSAGQVPEEALLAELTRLQRDWQEILALQTRGRSPQRLSPAHTPLSRVLTDRLQPEMKVTVTSPKALKEAKHASQKLFPQSTPEVSLWSNPVPLFEEMGIEEQIETALVKKITLEAGVSITLEQTEAMVVIDVNSGSLTRQQGKNSVALQSNLIAATEIARQIRLRNYAGIILVDFIQSMRRGEMGKLRRHMKELLQKDPVQAQLFEVTDLGLMQLTRRRARRSLHSLIAKPCPACQGEGWQETPVTALSKAVRRLESHMVHASGTAIHILAGVQIAGELSAHQSVIESHLARRLTIETDTGLPPLDFSLR